MIRLSPNFLNEFFRLVFLKKDVFEICKQYVKYEYIPDALSQYKKILKSVVNTNSDLPSIGVVSQQFINDLDVQEAISAINEAEIVAVDLIIDQLEDFIKNQRFKVLNDRVVELYSSGGDRRDEAIKLQAEESVEIVNFSLKKDNKSFLRLFSDFKSQQKERQINHQNGDDYKEKVPFGIDVLDDRTGGIDSGDTAMWIMRSGDGKSTALKWTGMYACRLGYNVLHIQLEGSKQEAYDKYSQIWTKASYNDIKNGDFNQSEIDKIEKYISRMNKQNKELYIYSFEKFGEASMIDVRDLIIDYHHVRGVFPDLVIIDSLDLLATGVNKKIDFDPNWKKEKMDKVAQLMKDLCTEFYPMRILTATQSSDFSEWNNPDKVMTRSNTEGNRTLVKPFSYVFTFNSTLDEKKARLGRVYIDKFRNYKIDDPIFKIKTDYDRGNFYDRVKTLEMYKKNEKL